MPKELPHQGVIGQLQVILEKMIALHEAMIPLLQKEQAACRKRLYDEMDLYFQAIEKILANIAEVNEQREKITAQLAEQLHLTGDKITVKEIDAALQGKSGLLPLRTRLLEVVTKADRLNQENKSTLEGVKDANEFLMDMFQRVSDRVSYSRLGSMNRSSVPAHLFSRRM